MTGTPRDHPRVGGEKQKLQSTRITLMGSPPHGRGKVNDSAAHADPVGITPAQAGKRHHRLQRRRGYREHPRIGGEKSSTCTRPSMVVGSPPHRRGKVRFQPRFQRCNGITPAWAGKSSSGFGRPYQHEDHPRMGGEKTDQAVIVRLVVGSPPHGRGKAKFEVNAGPHLGITPAWAGKSPASQPWSPPLWMMVIRPRP